MADPTETSVLSHPVPFGKYYLLERIATGLREAGVPEASLTSRY